MLTQTLPVTVLSFPAVRPVSGASIYDSLRSMDLFSQWPDADVLKLSSMGRERRLDKGDVLIRQDESNGRHLFLVMTGEATVTWEDAQGVELLLATLGTGDMAGEMELFDGGPNCATVRAATAVRVLAFHREDILRVLKEKPEHAMGFLGEISRRLRQSNRRITGICNHKTPRRVASILVSMLDERGVRMKDSDGRRCVLLRQRPTQRRIAELAGTTRETVSRLFTRWEGWCEDRNNDLMIYDEAKLRRMAGEE